MTTTFEDRLEDLISNAKENGKDVRGAYDISPDSTPTYTVEITKVMPE
jgi:hypothetical protein